MELSSYNYSRLMKITTPIILLHLIVLSILFFLKIPVLYYSILFFSFSVYIIIEMFRNNNKQVEYNKKYKIIIPLLSSLFIFYSFYHKGNNVFFYICSAFLFIYGVYTMLLSIKNNSKKDSSNKKNDFLVFSLIIITFIFTFLTSAYQYYILVKPF